MTPPPAVYDLMLLLDPAAEDAARAKILSDVSTMITGTGEQLRHDDWGARAMAYPIDHKTDAEYHLFQFHGAPALLNELDRTLRITDGIIRFRIIKLRPGTPDPPEVRATRRAEAEPVAAAATVDAS
jgi:small subunit ribosomal protein S6